MQKWKKEIRLGRRRTRRILRRRTKRRETARYRQMGHDRLVARLPKRRRPNGRRKRCIEAPKHLDLRDNFAKTVEFLETVRACAGSMVGKFYVDFTTLETLTPAAALLVVAEFDRWRELERGQRLGPIDIDKWDPTVRNRLLDMGFFELLGTIEPVQRVDHPDDGELYLPFSSGHRSEGEKAKSLRLAIESLGPKLRSPELLFQGLTEAMTNVQHHAYDDSAAVKRWWMSASVDQTGKRLRVMFVDHGLGIPRTLSLERVERFRRSAAAILPLGELLKNDAKLIEAAMVLNRSSTEELHRGFGLNRDVQGYIENLDVAGRLRIFSKRGQYTYSKNPGEKGRVKMSESPVSFDGTFIEWIIEDYAVELVHETHH